MASRISERRFAKADELWNYISSVEAPVDSNLQVVYRGHANADWELIPTILRGEAASLLADLVGLPMTCEDQAWMEFQMLRSFVTGCDEAGVRLPSDSVQFRQRRFTDLSFNDYHQFPSSWPGDDHLEIMAMARLHGLPTRLLDWTTHPYVAAYFAASEALRNRWAPDQRLAIIEISGVPRAGTHIGKIRLLRVRGAMSVNVVAQHGLFTVHPIVGDQGDPVRIESLQEYLPAPQSSFIRKLTLPIRECVRLYELCQSFRFNAARVFPNADGAGQSVMEGIRFALRYHATRQQAA